MDRLVHYAAHAMTLTDDLPTLPMRLTARMRMARWVRRVWFVLRGKR